MEFNYSSLFPLREGKIKFKKISDTFYEIKRFQNKNILVLHPEAFKLISEKAFFDVSHFYRSSHLKQLKKILEDPEASNNDKFVALSMLKNANISSNGILPMCQDTGTAIVNGYKGQNVYTGFDEGMYISEGIYQSYKNNNLRFSQLAPISMFEEKNTGSNLPAEINLYATEGNEYKFLFVQKGGGSANKSFLYQQTPAILNHEKLKKFLYDIIISLGTAACPPYHLAIVIGGTSAELNLKTVKLASTHYLDELPNNGNEKTGHAFRDIGWENIVLEMTREMGIGAQFGGKYYCHDVRVIRLPRHGASLPIGIGVSCSADRQIIGKINSHGIHIEKLEKNPAKFLPEIKNEDLDEKVIEINLDKSMDEILKQLNGCAIKTRVNLSGSLIVARDIAHAKILDYLNKNGELPHYFKQYPIYYAGPAKTPEGLPSGSFGPTTAGRMDSYVPIFQKNGGSMVMLAKGNRSKTVVNSCKKYGGFYLGSIGGVAAKVALESIKKVEVIEFAELGMEAIWKINVENFPAFVVIDNKGNDFYDIKKAN